MIVVFGINPGGFETQGAWFLVLLPAGLAAEPLAYFTYKIVPPLERVVYWISMGGLNFLWYWTISLVVIKSRRATTPG
jgi:hypothetical protein